MPWNPEQYDRFKAERQAPFHDLRNWLVHHPHLTGIDLGCGTGELTARLQASLPASHWVGRDSSAEMLAKAEPLSHARLRFEQGQLEDLSGSWDVIFSHAALQWVDDHAQLLPRLWEHLKPHGQLAIQMPSNHRHLTHRLLRELACEAPFQTALNGWNRSSPVLEIEAYAELLCDLGAKQLQVYEKVYPHHMPDADGLLEWVKGTALVPYLERLDPELQDVFLERYRSRIRAAFPPGSLFYGFRRILIYARKED